jgi:hypothetical protein
VNDAAHQRGEGWPPWVEQWVLPYVDDIALWPVLFALLGHVAVILVPLMVQVIRNQSLPALGVLGVLLWNTSLIVRMELRATGRPGRLTAAMVLTWVASLPLAWWTESTGVF